MFLGSLSTCRSHPFFKFSFFPLMVCCMHPEFVGIPSNPFFWNLPNSIGSNKIPNYDGSQLDRGSFHEMLRLFPLQTHLCSLQPKSSSSSVCRTCSQNASVLTGWFFCKLLMPNSVARMQQRVSLKILPWGPHLCRCGWTAGQHTALSTTSTRRAFATKQGFWLAIVAILWAIFCFLQSVLWPLLIFF